MLYESDPTTDSNRLEIGEPLYLYRPATGRVPWLTLTLQQRLQQSEDAFLASLALLAAVRDGCTGVHIDRTGRLMTVLARSCAQVSGRPVSEPEIRLLSQCAPLHDIGKIAVPDVILKKKGPLTADEYALVRRHPVIGSDILCRIQELSGDDPLFQPAIEMARCHHEHYDGSGYPNGLSGESIPVSAQLMAIADVYDALVTERPYKQAITHEAAVRILLHGDERTRPAHFSPLAREAFEQCERLFQMITLNDRAGMLSA